MRMRKKKHRDARLAACKCVHFASDFKLPAYLEIGCGKGGFICATALANPELNFVAVERNPDVMLLAMERAVSLGLANLRFIIGDAENLAEYFKPDEVSGIYLNFSDPWHKNCHAHKRLTHARYLDIYKIIMAPQAKLVIKTDNLPFFNYTLRSLQANNFDIISQTRDLYSCEDLYNNVQTEYEQKFISEGVKICRVEACI